MSAVCPGWYPLDEGEEDGAILREGERDCGNSGNANVVIEVGVEVGPIHTLRKHAVIQGFCSNIKGGHSAGHRTVSTSSARQLDPLKGRVLL